MLEISEGCLALGNFSSTRNHAVAVEVYYENCGDQVTFHTVRIAILVNAQQLLSIFSLPLQSDP